MGAAGGIYAVFHQDPRLLSESTPRPGFYLYSGCRFDHRARRFDHGNLRQRRDRVKDLIRHARDTVDHIYSDGSGQSEKWRLHCSPQFYDQKLCPDALGNHTQGVEMEHNKLIRTAADGRLPCGRVARLGPKPRDRGTHDLELLPPSQKAYSDRSRLKCGQCLKYLKRPRGVKLGGLSLSAPGAQRRKRHPHLCPMYFMVLAGRVRLVLELFRRGMRIPKRRSCRGPLRICYGRAISTSV